MRHRVAHRKLGRVTEHRLAMLRNQAQALLQHERIQTTLPRAKELRPFVERIITTAKRGIADGAPDGRALHARRLVRRDIASPGVVSKLFDTLAPRFAERQGGYTRILRLGFRRGDAAELAQIELVGSEWAPKKSADKPEETVAKSKGVGGRLRAAASRMRRRKPPTEEQEDAKPAKASKTPKTAKADAPKSGSGASRSKAKSPKRSGGKKAE